MKKQHFLLIPAIAILAAACTGNRHEELREKVKGFWQVTQYQRSGETNEMYAQINDSIILYWYDQVNYIFPYGYRIDGDELIVWLHNDSLSRPKVMGTLNHLGADGFSLENEEQRLEYKRAEVEDFQRATGREWKGLD